MAPHFDETSARRDRLHIFQAMMCVAAIVLLVARSRWGYAVGLSIAAFWNYTNLFVTGFFRNGLDALTNLMATGRLTHIDQLIAVAAVAFLSMMIGGALTALCLKPCSPTSDVFHIVLALIVSTAYFAAIVAAFQPRYLQRMVCFSLPSG